MGEPPRPRKFTDLQLSLARPATGPPTPQVPPPSPTFIYAPLQPESPGSVLSPSTTSANKPPIFPPLEGKAISRPSLKSRPESPSFLRREQRTDPDLPNFMREFDKIVRRRSFNPNEPAPPRPTELGRPHSVYRMDNSPTSRLSDPELPEKLDRDRRKSDFLSRYEELTCRAALAIKSVDQMVKPQDQVLPTDPVHPTTPKPGLLAPTLSQTTCLASPVTPDIEFNEEEVLRTCQDFLQDYDRSLASRERTPPYLPSRDITPPVPAPRHSLMARQASPVQPRQPSPVPGRQASKPSPVVRQPSPVVARQPSPALSKEDEQLLAAAQGKSFWESPGQETIFDKIDNVIPEVFDSKIIRTRSSSLTLHDKRVLEGDEKLKPILKKSTEDLGDVHRFPSILKTRDDCGFFPSNLLKSKPDHVRIQSPSFDNTENIRMRSPSPDFDNESIDQNGEQVLEDNQSQSPEVASILKNRYRRASADSLSFGLDGEEEEGRGGILKMRRKASFGSGCHSPVERDESTKSILKKSSRNSSRTCSRSGSTEELDLESTKSILKSNRSSRTCSRSGSQEELDLDFDDEWDPKPKSILKKKPGSTDDELEDQPKSILKSRRSEESLSPSSEPVDRDTPSHSCLRDCRSSSGTRQSSVISDSEELGQASPRPWSSPPSALPPREDAPHSILKRRERSASPLLHHPLPPEEQLHRSSLHLDLGADSAGPESAAGGDLPGKRKVME